MTVVAVQSSLRAPWCSNQFSYSVNLNLIFANYDSELRLGDLKRIVVSNAVAPGPLVAPLCR
jgi:hypothetical protein